MKNRFIIIYTIFSALVFTFAIAFFGFNLYTEYSNGKTRTVKKFENIVNTVKLNSKDTNINTINNKLNESINTLNDFSYISIKVNETEIYKYPVNLSKSQTSSRLTTSYEKMIKTDYGTFTIDCNMYLLRPASIVYFAKISFLIILIITLITIIMIVYLNMTENAESEAPVEQISVTSNDIPVSTPAVEVQEENKEEISEVNASENNVTVIDNETTASSETSETEEVVQATEAEAIEKNEQEQTITEEKVELPSEEIKPANLEINDSSTTPAGLFNPETGFGWESYLMTRLDNEINRAIASEIDMSLFIFEIPSLPRDSETMKNICNYLAIQFQFKDLLFEYKNDCLVAMKISMNIDEALNFADKLYADIKELLEGKECYIGISTRSIRMVSGERLIHEADQALVHAKADDSPIIAFRVDAEKYRQYLEQNNK